MPVTVPDVLNSGLPVLAAGEVARREMIRLPRSVIPVESRIWIGCRPESAPAWLASMRGNPVELDPARLLPILESAYT